MVSRQWKICIGLEIHAQITTMTKLFSRAERPNQFSFPNSCVSYFDAALPGTLPHLNKEVVNQAVKAAVSMGCKVNKRSMFERKHYFYQDLPLGYQITQQRYPIAHDGKLYYEHKSGTGGVASSRVGIERIQIEQDSGKSMHDSHDEYSLVDLNRAGNGLIEIVFAPDLSQPEQASGLLRTVQELLRHLNICDGNLENGSMRCDVNVSVQDANNIKAKVPRVEIKNLNSMQRVQLASQHEIARQINLIESGTGVEQETRGYDPDSNTTFGMRSKEAAMDYRFMPDPDLPVLLLTDDDVTHIANSIPELPHATKERLLALGLDAYQVNVLVSKQAVKYFQQAYSLSLAKTISHAQHQQQQPHTLAVLIFNWVTSELLGHLNQGNTPFAQSPVSPEQLAQVIELLLLNHITAAQAKSLVAALFLDANSSANALDVMKKYDMKVIQSSSVAEEASKLQLLCSESLADPGNLDQFTRMKAGQVKLLKYFIGDVMKRSKGQANPKQIEAQLNELIK